MEPLQTADALEGQVEELRNVLAANAETPVTLIGFSWGAWLSVLVAAKDPALIGKLILVGAGPFEERYAAGIMERRLQRLGAVERAEAASALDALNNSQGDQDAALRRLGRLLGRADSFDPQECEPEETECQGDRFQQLWREAAQLRRSGELLQVVRRIRCPVVAIHGDYDPHPAAGVQETLSRVLTDFRFILLKDCGHKPWIERQARNEFYRVLREGLQ